MNKWSSSESQPAVFSQLLAELLNKLRLSYAASPHTEPTWPICSRLEVQANLLSGLARESGLDDLQQFTLVLTELAVLGRDEPGHIPAAWSGALVRLAEFLDRMLTGLDAGDTPAQWLDDTQWEKLTSWFSSLETPIIVMEELEEVLLHWQNSWCDGALDVKHEAELQDRWLQLRKFGDALFCLPTDEEDSSLLQWKGFTP